MIALSLLFLALFILIILSLLSINKYPQICPLRYTFLLLYAWLGKAYRWLNGTSRIPLVRLFDVIVLATTFQFFLSHMNTKSDNASPTNHIIINANLSAVHNLSENWIGSLNASLPSSGSLLQGVLTGPTGGTIYESPHFLLSLVDTIKSNWPAILVAWFIFELLRLVVVSSKNLRIEEVNENKNKSKDEADSKDAGDAKEEQSSAQGLGNLLMVKLNRISELYQAVDEQRSIKSEGLGRPIEANMRS
jgi:hypothetical protein